MAESTPVQITNEGSELQLENVTVRDSDVVEYFDERAEEAEVRRVLSVGVQAIRAAGTASDVDFVEKRFQELRYEFEQEITDLENTIEETFADENGDVPQLLDGHVDELEETLDEFIGEDHDAIQDALHPESDNSPITPLTDEVQDLRDLVKELTGRKQERQKGTQKGGDFEDDVQAELQESLTGPMDNLEPTGTEVGQKGTSKKGDFLITTSTNQTIAIEAKNRTNSMSKDKIGEYLEKTLQNREADHAIMVMRNAEAVPTTKMGWFYEYDRRRLCVVLSEGPDEPIQWEFLRYAYNWARTRVEQAQASIDETGADEINSELEEIEERIGDFESMRNSARTIREEASDLEDALDAMDRAIMRRLHRAKKELESDIGE